MIEQKRIEDIKKELVANSENILKSLSNQIPAGNFLFRDYGICPAAGSRCSDGGDIIGSSPNREPAPSGYLGSQNCLRCRHFITGPAFLGGLLSLSNEISLQANHQAAQYNKLQSKSDTLTNEVDILDEAEYDAIKSNHDFDSTKRNELQLHLRKVQSEVESAAKKLDMFLTDLQAAIRLIKQSHALINQILNQDESTISTQLVTDSDHELHLSINETSYFQQLCEVCENAEIYESASGDIATLPRSQLLDKMAALNKLQPRFFTLNHKQQLIVGNQMVNLLLARLKTWANVDALIDGRIQLEDLPENERISRRDLEMLFKPQMLQKQEATS